MDFYEKYSVTDVKKILLSQDAFAVSEAIHMLREELEETRKRAKK